MISELTDRYVRNKLTEAELADYKLRLFQSTELQDELEATLVLKQALRLEKKPPNNPLINLFPPINPPEPGTTLH